MLIEIYDNYNEVKFKLDDKFRKIYVRPDSTKGDRFNATLYPSKNQFINLKTRPLPLASLVSKEEAVEAAFRKAELIFIEESPFKEVTT